MQSTAADRRAQEHGKSCRLGSFHVSIRPRKGSADSNAVSDLPLNTPGQIRFSGQMREWRLCVYARIATVTHPMPVLSTQLEEFIVSGAHAAQRAGALPACRLPEHAHLSRPKRPEWGDYSCALPLQLAKPMQQPPLEIAAQIEKHLPESVLLGKTSVSPPGFVNISLAGDWLAAQVDAVLRSGPTYADLHYATGKKAQVEFVSANPTGPLTVGHGRGGVVGDTISGLLSAVGYQVTREFYYNNAGQQMRRLGESLRLRYLQALGQSVDLAEDHYYGEYLAQSGRGLHAEHGDGLANADWDAFKDLAEEAIAGQQRETMKRLGIRMDVFFNEHSLYEDGSVEKVTEALRENGLAYDRDGALWLAATALGGPDDRVIVKSSGEPTYRLPDIAYHCNKLERGFDLVVDVLGADHKDSFPDVLRGVQALGHDGAGIKMLMHQFVTLKGERMSKRSGRFTSLDELIDEVGAAVVRFFMLMRAAESHLEFDLDLARDQSEKNPVYYVQYAHARICSILAKAQVEGFSDESGEEKLLRHPTEHVLIRQLLELADTIDRAVRDLAPHHLTTYARELAGSFHAFYRDCRVVDAENRALTLARLKLVRAAGIGLARTLELLGVSAPEAM